MGIVSPKTTRDRYRHALTGCIPDLEGDVTLEPSNHVLNWRLDDLDDDNRPEGFEIGVPEDPDGWWVYLSERNGAPSTLAAQNSSRLDLDEDLYHITENWVGGHTPRSYQFAAKLPQPSQPDIDVIASSNVGLEAGTYKLSYTWIDGDEHTALAPVITLTVGLGQSIRVYLPTDAPEGATAIGIWMTSANGDVSTLRLQNYVDVSIDMPESLLISKYTVKRTTPAENETRKKKPKKPKSKKKKRRGGKSKKGKHKARITRVDRRRGRESQPSDFSDEVDLSESDAARGIGFGAETGTKGSYNVYVNRDGKDYRLNTQDSGGRRGSKRPHKKKKRRRGGRGKKSTHVTSGLTANERANSSSPRGEDLTPATPPSQEETGVEDPSSPLDSAVAEGNVIISPGTYWVAISHAVRGEETLVSVPQQVTISSGQTILVHFPDSNNLLKNAQWRDRAANGTPFSWTISGVGVGNGAYSVTADHTLTLDSLGARTGTQASPSASQIMDIIRSQIYAVGGKVSAALSAGSFAVIVREFNSAGTVVRNTTVTELFSSGSGVTFKRVFGPGYQDFHPDTTSISLVALFAGSTRNGIGYVHELFVNPNSSIRIRRMADPLPESHQASNADPPDHLRWSKASVVGVSLPPSSPRTPWQHQPIATQDWETSSMQNWVPRVDNAQGVINTRSAFVGINSAYGYQIQKDTSSTRYNYLSYYTNDLIRPRLAQRFQVRVPRAPTSGVAVFAAIKHLGAIDGVNYTLGAVGMDSLGNTYLMTPLYQGGPWDYRFVSGGLRPGDIYDIELRVDGANTTNGAASVSLGKNFAARTAGASRSGINFTGLYARHAYLGVFDFTDPQVQYSFHFDDIILTRNGYFGSSLEGFPDGMPTPNPDRPFRDPSVLEDVTFEAGTIPAPWSPVSSHAGTATEVAVGGAYAIDGTVGVRCRDFGTSTLGTAYITRSFSPTRSRAGLRAKFRINTLPTSGWVEIMQLVSSGGSVVGAVGLDSAGVLYATSRTDTDAFNKQSTIATNITANSTFTLEMVATDLSTDHGSLACWIYRGTAGSISERSLMTSHYLIPWTARVLDSVRLGVCNQSVAASTVTLHLDSVRLTDEGEVLFREEDERGAAIYQAYMFYPTYGYKRDDLGLKGLEMAVQPGETYTFSIYARHTDVPSHSPAFPYTFYAYDQNGEEHRLGCLYGEGGATGTMAWTELSQTWTIPEDCYVVTMESPGIISGELVCQEPAISRGTEATREVYYPETGQIWAILDTETPNNFAFAIESPLENRWLDVGLITDTPTGTSTNIQVNSSDPNEQAGLTGTELPTSWLTDLTSVVQRKYAHFLITLNASSDLRETPTLATETPYVDFYTGIGAEQLNVLLRDDLSEFSGGVYLSDLPFFRELSRFDVREPVGMVRRQRMWDPVGDLGGFTINAYTQEAIRDIEENCLSQDFAIETRDYRLLVRFREQIQFDVDHQSVKKIRGVWCARASASVEGVEVVEALPVEQLRDVWVAP